MDRQQLYELLFLKHGTLVLSRKQCAVELGCSTATLDRLKDAGLGPQYIKGKGKNGAVNYPIDALVDYIIKAQVKTA